MIKGIYRPRWQWWAPWQVTSFWRPRVERACDEYCNPSVLLVLPPLGAFVVFYAPGPLRTEAEGPCDDCKAEDARLEAEGWTVVRDY